MDTDSGLKIIHFHFLKLFDARCLVLFVFSSIYLSIYHVFFSSAILKIVLIFCPERWFELGFIFQGRFHAVFFLNLKYMYTIASFNTTVKSNSLSGS